MIDRERSVFCDRVLEFIGEPKTAADAVAIGEALIGMGVEMLRQHGCTREDIARAILDPRNFFPGEAS